jgi:hypothetical protein
VSAVERSISYSLSRSGSMCSNDRRPLAYGPAADRIRLRADNRLGAVYSALYSFWSARHAAVTASQQAANARRGLDAVYSAVYSLWSASSATVTDQQRIGSRRDAYSVVLFSDSTKIALVNDFTSSPDLLLYSLLGEDAGGGTNFSVALRAAQSVMLQNWSTERLVT